VKPAAEPAAAAVPAPKLTKEECEARAKMNEKVLLKTAEIKTWQTAGIKFHDEFHDISLKKELKLPVPGGDCVITVSLPELELFASELADRRVLIHFRSLGGGTSAASGHIKSQICKLILDDRTPAVDILLKSKAPTIAPTDYFFRLRIERTEMDVDNQFFVPVSDSFLPAATEQLFDVTACTLVATQKDVVLLPKSYHTERCTVLLREDQLAGLNDVLVVLERTTDHSMNIGMRKLILVPKVLTRMSCDQEANMATVEVRIYNASKQRLRLSKNTNIGKVFLPKAAGFFNRRATAVVTEEKPFHAGDKITVSKLDILYCNF
jgi:hypothetical protein